MFGNDVKKRDKRLDFPFCRIYFLNVLSIFGRKLVVNLDLYSLKPLILLALFIQ